MRGLLFGLALVLTFLASARLYYSRSVIDDTGSFILFLAAVVAVCGEVVVYYLTRILLHLQVEKWRQ
jgi:hypothetical protein